MKILSLFRYLGVAVTVALLVLVACEVGYGQTVITTGPITTNDNVEWTLAPEVAATPSAAMTIQLRVRDNVQTGPFMTILPASCVTATTAPNVPAGSSTCTSKVTTQLRDTVNVRGTHQLFGFAFDPAANNGTGLESTASIPFVLTTPLGAPTGLRLTR
jgi:hypothetical protein